MPSWGFLYYTSECVIRLVMIVYVPQRRSPAAARAWLLLILLFPWAGLVLYAAEDPIDIRSVGSRFQTSHRASGFAQVQRVWRAMREYF